MTDIKIFFELIQVTLVTGICLYHTLMGFASCGVGPMEVFKLQEVRLALKRTSR